MAAPALSASGLPSFPAMLAPPPRFRAATFAAYRVDPAVPGQAEAVAAVQAFAARRVGVLARWFGRAGPPGLYLEGSFGVGKTHLLAACWHAAAGVRHYLSFAEAMGLMALLGPEETSRRLRGDLVCLDEFELDDPANTRFADLLLERLAAHGTRFVTTSNTVVGEQGDGRMAVDLFRDQLTRIGAAFACVHVPGGDHRRLSVRDGDDPPGWRRQTGPPPGADWLDADAAGLDRMLAGLPLTGLRGLAGTVRGVRVRELGPFSDQIAALRFVALVDRLYDWCVPMRIEATCALAELFPEPPLRSAFHRKHRRCQSRLTELCV